MEAVEVTQALTHALRVMAQLEFQHIHAHTGHPWNELADTAADNALKGTVDCQIPLPIGRWILEGQAIQWLFIAMPNLLCILQYPAVEGQKLKFARPSSQLLQSEISGSMRCGERVTNSIDKEAAQHSTFLDFKCASANVPSLRGGSQPIGLMLEGRSAYIQRMCHEAGLAFVGGQESRMPGVDTRTSQCYNATSSGCDEHHSLGVDVWVHIERSPCAKADQEHVLMLGT